MQHPTATIFFSLWLLAVLCLPGLRGLLVNLIERIGGQVLRLFRFVNQRRWEFAYGSLTCCVLGLFIAWPALMHGGYFSSAPGEEPAGEDDAPVAAERSPGSMPPLEYQISVADCIVIAETRIENGAVSFELRDVWKAPEDCSTSNDSVMTPDIGNFQLRGYLPKAGQLAVLFFTPGRDGEPQLFVLLPVYKDRVVYAPDDPPVKRKLDLIELRQLVAAAPAGAVGEPTPEPAN